VLAKLLLCHTSHYLNPHPPRTVISCGRATSEMGTLRPPKRRGSGCYRPETLTHAGYRPWLALLPWHPHGVAVFVRSRGSRSGSSRRLRRAARTRERLPSRLRGKAGPRRERERVARGAGPRVGAADMPVQRGREPTLAGLPLVAPATLLARRERAVTGHPVEKPVRAPAGPPTCRPSPWRSAVDFWMPWV
jgi:hypothetical protein